MASPESPIPKVEIKRRRVANDGLLARLSNVMLEEFLGDFAWVFVLIASVAATVGLVWLMSRAFG